MTAAFIRIVACKDIIIFSSLSMWCPLLFLQSKLIRWCCFCYLVRHFVFRNTCDEESGEIFSGLPSNSRTANPQHPRNRFQHFWTFRFLFPECGLLPTASFEGLPSNPYLISSHWIITETLRVIIEIFSVEGFPSFKQSLIHIRWACDGHTCSFRGVLPAKQLSTGV